ncbi:MAG: glutamate formimidoyltransferase [Planctomycetota bacterium]
MPQRIVECVPNFSEGRDLARLEKILEVIRAVNGAQLIDVDSGYETNRTVVTIVGAPEAVEEAAFRAIERAAQVIDMSSHTGAHARHGATDVCPFVPVAGVTMADCVALAHRLGKRVGDELGIPVYLYEHAARRPERRSLAAVRKGEYEALPHKLTRPEWAPDFGPTKFLPRTGVVTIGAREFLIAYNINLNSRSKEHATDLAFEIRESGRQVRRQQDSPIYMSGQLVKYRPSARLWPCAYCDQDESSAAALESHYQTAHSRSFYQDVAFFGEDIAHLEGKIVQKRGTFTECRAVGWMIPEYGRAQISINLTNFKETPAHLVLEETRRLAKARGIVITGSEIVGVVPFQAMRESGEFYLKTQRSSRGVPINDIVETAVQSLGLRDLGAFDARKSILGLPPEPGALARMKVCELVDEVSRATPAPGGGSISALAGSLAAALAAMVANITHTKPKLRAVHARMEEIAMRCQPLKDALLRAVDDDTSAFNEVVAAMRLPSETESQKTARTAALEAGYKQATLVPYQTAELCLAALRECRAAIDGCLPASISDVGVGGLLAHAGLRGGIYNVKINLGEIRDRAWVTERQANLGAMLDEGARLAAEIEAGVAKSFAGAQHAESR